MSLPSNLKILYAEWLQDLIEGLNPRQEQLAVAYEKARRHLLETDDAIFFPKDLRKIKGIGETIMKRLEKKLLQHCQEIGAEFPRPKETVQWDRSPKRTITALRFKSSENDQSDFKEPDDSPETKRRKTNYIPRKRSGGYGILLALLELNATVKGVSKDTIIKTGQKFCDNSMDPNFMTKELRGAWSAINSLMKHELVIEEGRPKRYLLTKKGTKLANTLKSEADIVFNNEIRSYPDSQIGINNDDPEITADFSALVGSEETKQHKGLLKGDETSLLDITFSNSTPDQTQQGPLSACNVDCQLIPSETESDKLEDNDGNKILKRRFDGIGYELWQNGSYDIRLVIDHREIKSHVNREFFSAALERRGMKCCSRQLALGDIIWVAKHKETGNECVLNTIIERKRLDDLAFSIRDNRFMEQKSRLDKSGCKNKYYLVEETVGKGIEGMNEALKTALWLILVYYRFSMVRTSNSDETVERLHALYMVITREYAKKNLLVIYPNNLRNQDDYSKVLERFRAEFERVHHIECCHSFQCFQEILGKGELSTIRELTIQILMYVKGVSIEKAVAIQALYPTLNHLLIAYRNCRSSEEAKLLMFNKLGEAPGAKKITRSLSEKIAQTFGSLES